MPVPIRVARKRPFWGRCMSAPVFYALGLILPFKVAESNNFVSGAKPNPNFITLTCRLQSMGFSENARRRDDNDLLTIRCSRFDLSYAIRTDGRPPDHARPGASRRAWSK